MKARRILFVSILLLLAAAATIHLMRSNRGGRESPRKAKSDQRDHPNKEVHPALNEQPVVEAPRKPPVTYAISTAKLEKGPSKEDFLDARIRAKDGSLINIIGAPNYAVVLWMAGSPEAASEVETKIKIAIQEIWGILREKNKAVGPLPWEAGRKAHLKGLDHEELAAITGSLQAALKGAIDDDRVGQFIKRFAEETKVYTHSMDVEVTQEKGPELTVAAGIGRLRLWYRVVERSERGVISDQKFTDSPGMLGSQYVESRAPMR